MCFILFRSLNSKQPGPSLYEIAAVRPIKSNLKVLNKAKQKYKIEVVNG